MTNAFTLAVTAAAIYGYVSFISPTLDPFASLGCCLANASDNLREQAKKTSEFSLFGQDETYLALVDQARNCSLTNSNNEVNIDESRALTINI